MSTLDTGGLTRSVKISDQPPLFVPVKDQNI